VSSVTVIDQLVIKLGLDPRDFTKGEKQVAADVLKTQQTVERSTGSMSKQLTGLATRWIAVGTAVALVKKAVNAIDDVANRTRQLGIDAKNYDVAADRLRNFENAMVMMGGNAEATRQSVSGFQKAMFDLAYNGQISDSLVMLGRLGVQFQDASGHARKFQDVVLDTADAIGKAQEQGMTRADAFQYLQQSGFDPGTANAILAGRKAVETELARQQNRIQVTPDAIQAAEHVTTSRIEKEQQIEGFKVAELGGGAGNVQAAVNEAIAHPVVALHKLGDAASHAGSAIAGWARGAVSKLDQERFTPTVNAAAQKYGINPVLLRNLIKTESNFNPRARSKAGAVGVAQLLPKYFPDAGQNADRDIYTAAEYLKQLHDSFVKSGDADDAGAWYLATQSYNAGQTRVRASRKPGGKPLTKETQDYPGKVLAGVDLGQHQTDATPTAGRAGGNVTNVQIDNIAVHTQATDADTIASDMDAAVVRKLMASHAEGGMQ
jgi:soluble lytic murein transglycosylase-like protein